MLSHLRPKYFGREFVSQKPEMMYPILFASMRSNTKNLAMLLRIVLIQRNNSQRLDKIFVFISFVNSMDPRRLLRFQTWDTVVYHAKSCNVG
jgi:hypothetical protein